MTRSEYKTAERDESYGQGHPHQVDYALNPSTPDEPEGSSWLWSKGAPVFVSKDSLKDKEQLAQSTPRKRGRPRKNPQVLSTGTIAPVRPSLAAGAVPRKRGRPRKIRPEEEQASAAQNSGISAESAGQGAAVRRKRGRPRKDTQDAAPALAAQRTFIVSALASSGAATDEPGQGIQRSLLKSDFVSDDNSPAQGYLENAHVKDSPQSGSSQTNDALSGKSRTEALEPSSQQKRPVWATQEAIRSGKISRVWNARLNKPDYGLSYSWESYQALQNKAVLDIKIEQGRATAIVDYKGEAQVNIEFSPVDDMHWRDLVDRCGLNCEGWVTLLAGNITFEDIRKFYIDPAGLVPSGREVRTTCTCPMSMEHGCVHATTALYALGAWLQDHPLDLLTLRSANREVLFARSRKLRGEDRIGIPGFTDRKLIELFNVAAG